MIRFSMISPAIAQFESSHQTFQSLSQCLIIFGSEDNGNCQVTREESKLMLNVVQCISKHRSKMQSTSFLCPTFRRAIFQLNVGAAFQWTLLRVDKSGQRVSWIIDRFICYLLTKNTNKDVPIAFTRLKNCLPLPLHLVIGNRNPSMYLTHQNVRRHAQLARQNTAVNLILTSPFWKY